jgi:glucokinase
MFLGIEIGGTKLQLGLGNGDGIITALWRGTVKPSEGSEGIRRQIEVAVPQLFAKANANRELLRGVGIGFGGPTDDATQTVIKSHQIAGWDGFPLAEWIQDFVGAPAVLCNDADVGGLAEALHGAGKGLSPIFYMTLGSGIGGGLVIDGQVYRGVGRGAAEIGHLLVRDWLPREQPRTATLESVCSGWGIEAHALEVMEEVSEQASERFRTEALTAKWIADRARQGDSTALAILNKSWEVLAEAIYQLIVLLCPKRIVIGGGVSLMGEDLLFEPLRRLVAEGVFRPFRGLTDIVPALLGEEVVVHGALALARQRFGP